jgi:hypothetical protein
VSLDSEFINGLAGVVALVNSLVLVPSVMALRKIAQNHDERIKTLEARKPRARARRR